MPKMTAMSETEYLFSYGTLQQDNVEQETYGRSLVGETDHLIGFKMGSVAISDADVIRKSGLDVHPVAVSTGNIQDEIPERELRARVSVRYAFIHCPAVHVYLHEKGGPPCGVFGAVDVPGADGAFQRVLRMA